MVDTFTLNQLVRYTYSECSPIEKIMIEEVAAEDWGVKEEMARLSAAKRYIPQVLFSAKPTSLERILNYSQNSF